jgi:threonyl-tRNA synthetase
VRDTHDEYATDIAKQLKSVGLRVELSDSKNGLGKSVRNAKNLKYPYWVVIGDNEISTNTLTVESLKGEKFSITLEDLIVKLKEEVSSKK